MNNINTPLTPSQRHIWQSQIISPDKPMFNQIVTARLNPHTFSPAQADALCDAWLNVQQQHPVLGSTITSEDVMHPLQRYHQSLHPMEQLQLDTTDASEADSVEDWIRQRGARIFTLEDKLHDAVLLRLGNGGFMLYLNMHHLIADAISTQLVLQALMTAFEAGQSGEASNAPILQFRDYAQQLAQQMPAVKRAGSTPEAHVKSIGATPHLSNAMFYGVVNNEPTTASTRQRVPLSIEQRKAIRTLAGEPDLKQLNDNLSLMCLHATVLVLYLHKATSDEHIVIEAPLSGRFEQRLKRMTGNLIEMVRLEIVVEPSLSLLQLYQRVRDQLFYVLGKACAGCTRELKPVRVHGVLNMITHEETIGSAALQSIRWHHPGHSDTHHPLRLHASDWNKTGLSLIEADFNQGFFSGVRTQRACEHLKAAYVLLLASRDTQIKAVSLLGAEEQWYFRGVPDLLPGGDFRSLIDRVVGNCRQTPEAVALCDNAGGEIDYRSLHKGMMNASSGLARIGVGRHDRVVVLMRRSIDLPVVLLGILKSGAAYIPVDHDQPEARIAQIIEDAHATCVIVDDALWQSRGEQQPFDHSKVMKAEALLAGDSEGSVAPDSSSASVVVHSVLDGSNAKVEIDAAPHVSASGLQAEDTAYIIFTSGSTGKPKGVVVSHAALMAYLGWANDYYALQEPVVMPLHTSIGFDMTVTSLFLPLLNGGMIKVFGESGTRQGSNALALFAAISDSQVNTVKLTPSHLALLNDTTVPGANIRQLIVGGEDLKSSTARFTAARFGQNVRIINEYGPSEATVGCIVHQWDKRSRSTSVPIGLPISGMSAYVLDEHGQPQFEGAVGELYLSGQSLADGYWNNTMQTDAAFVESPWVPDERLYKTGDLVRADEGHLCYLGRGDTQIKRNGYRVELSEVEAIIATHPKVTDCVAALETTSVAAVKPEAVVAKQAPELHCSRCGLSSKHPDGNLVADGLCALCASFLPNQDRVN
ncbi:MAG: amino acid adenylation domain-containing protein, partial [Granulosicoccus sp.]